MSPQFTQLFEEDRKEYIRQLENILRLNEQKLFKCEEKIKSETSLLVLQKYKLKNSIKSLKTKIPKITKLLIRLKNGEYDSSDLRSASAMIGAHATFKFDYESIDQPGLNSEDKRLQTVFNICQQQPNEQVSRVYQQVDGGYDPTPSISLLNSDPIITSDEQTAQLLNESSFSPSDLDDLVLNSPQSSLSGQKVYQQVDGGYDPTPSISLLNSDPIITSDEQTAQLLNESSFSPSDLDDLVLNSPQSSLSGQQVYQQVDGGYDPTPSISLLNSDPIITSDEQTAQLLNESSFSPSDLDDLVLNSPQSGLSSSEFRLQSLTQKQSREKITQSGANLQNLQQEGQKTHDFPRRAIANWVDKQKQQILPSSQQKNFYASKKMEINTTHSHNIESPISTSDEYLKSQLQSTNATNLNQEKVPQPKLIPIKPTVIVEVDQQPILVLDASSPFYGTLSAEVPQQPISSKLRPNSSTVQQHSDANKSTHHSIFLKNTLNRLGKRKADFDQTEQDKFKAYNQLQELPDKRCKNEEQNRQKNKEDIIENKQMQEIQLPQLNRYKSILLFHSEKMRIIQLVESVNNYNLDRLYDMQDEVDKEKDNEIRKQLIRRYRNLKYVLRNRMDLLNRFKKGDVTLEEFNHLIRISHREEKRLQDFVNVQQQSNEPGPSRSDTSKPVSELEQLKASLQQLNKDEEYLKSKWEESEQKRRNEKFLREEEQSPEEIKWEQQQQRIREKEYNAELQELHKTKQTLENILEQKRLEPQQLDQLEKDKQETITLTQANSQGQLQVSAQPGSSRIDISTSPQQDDNEIVSFENDEKFDALVETILDAPCESADVTITSPHPQTINWWTELVQKFKDSFTAIPPDPISAAEIRTKIRQEAKSRQEERARLKKVAVTKSDLLKQKGKWVQDLKKEKSELWNQWCDNNMQLPENSHKRYIEISDLLVKTKLEINQLQEDIRKLKYYFKKLTVVLGAIVDAYVWLRDGLSAPGFRYEVENSFENQRKNALNDLLPSLIEKEEGAYSENALDRVKTEFFEITGINLKDRKNLTEFNKSLEKCRNLRVELQGWQIFSAQVEYAKEIRTAQQKQADSTPSGMAEKKR